MVVAEKTEVLTAAAVTAGSVNWAEVIKQSPCCVSREIRLICRNQNLLLKQV